MTQEGEEPILVLSASPWALGNVQLADCLISTMSCKSNNLIGLCAPRLCVLDKSEYCTGSVMLLKYCFTCTCAQPSVKLCHAI